MEDEASVAEVGADALGKGCVRVVVRSLERIGGDFSVFAAQIADLASLRGGRIAGRVFSSLEGVKVSQGLRAVAIFGHWVYVQVVGWITELDMSFLVARTGDGL